MAYIREERRPILKPLLFSSHNSKLMAINSYKARLLLSSENKSEKKTKHIESQTVVTATNNSTTDRVSESITNINTVIPVYSTFLKNKWKWGSTKTRNEDKYKESEDCECYINTNEEPKNNRQREFRFKDNVMRFCEKSTMTPNLQDECCGLCCPFDLEKECKEDYDFKEDQRNKYLDEENCSNFDENTNSCYPKCYDKACLQETKVDFDGPITNYEKLQETKVDFDGPIRNYEKLVLYPRKDVPYTEFGGPCNRRYGRHQYQDQTLGERSRKSMRHVKAVRPRSGTPERKLRKTGQIRFADVNDVPYSHNRHSKYHKNCLMSDYKTNHVGDEPDVLLTGCEMCNKKIHYYRNQSRRERMSPVKLPKRLLISETLERPLSC